MQFKFSDMRLSPGVGIRLSTPIGLARVDYGFNVDPSIGEPRGKIYFSMGQAF
jgi:outer membrane translocation and assembly module TamA